MKKPKTPTAVTSAILTLITVFFWAGFQIYRSLATKAPPVVPQEVIEPLDPNLDITTLNSIGQRLYFQDSDIGNIQASSVPVPIETPQPTSIPGSPVSSASATPTTEATPSATP